MSDPREEFEKWVKYTAEKFEYIYMSRILERNGDDYSTTWVDCAWMGWQAARAQDGREPVATINEKHGFSVEDAVRYIKLPVGTKLYTRLPSDVVPEGWKLVPIESTSEMDLAVVDADLDVPVDRDHAEAIWKIMIAVAPQRPDQDQ
jgi:hypothetical protein